MTPITFRSFIMKADNLKKKTRYDTYICYNKFMKKSNDRDLYVTMKMSNTCITSFLVFVLYFVGKRKS